MRARHAAALVLASLLIVGCSGPAANSAAAPAAGAAAAVQSSGAGTAGTPGAQPAPFDFASGRVKWVEGTTVLVSTATEVLTVKTTGDTRIERVSTGTAEDIATGSTIVVRGTRDGANVTAQMVQIGDLMGGGMPQGFGGQAPRVGNGNGTRPVGTPGAGGTRPQGAGGAGRTGGNNFVVGQVKEVKGNTILLTTQSNTVTVTMTDKTLIQRTVSATLADLTVGERITAQGTRDSGNTLSARAIQVGSVAPGGGAPPSGTPGPEQQPPAPPPSGG